MNQEASQPHQSCASRIGVGLLAAVSLHYTIYTAGSIVTGLWEKHHGYTVMYGESPFQLLYWFGWRLAVIWWGKPRLLEWMLLFTLFVGYWLLVAFAASWHPDSPEEQEIALFSQAMFVACCCAWGPAALLAFVRRMLKELGIQK